MNSIVERLRGFKSAAAQAWSHEAADLIEQQAERIKELEAERDGWREDANISRNSIAMLKDRCNHFEDTLAALRQRIADAPVVAWLHTQSNGCSSLIRTPPSAFDPQDLADAEVSIYALISKEDLQK